MASELAVMGEDTSVSLWRTPEKVLEEAHLAAKALIKVVELKPKKVVFNGETFLECEDWQTVGKFYGCTTRLESDQYVEYGGVRGFEATVVVVDREGRILGRAVSMTLSDEENWGDVPKYEWVNELDANGKKIWVEGKNGKKGFFKGEKKEIGRFPKPLFQLRSMAQTRAQSKALKSVFAWVVVLAGYQPTPAEELTGNEFGEEQGGEEPRKPVDMPKEKQALQFKGVITTRKDGKEDTVWMMVGDKMVVSSANMATKFPFAVGDGFTFTANEKAGANGSIWLLQTVTEYATAAKVGEEKAAEPEKKSEEPIGDLEETRTGKMGRSREVRLYTLMTQNKDKTGLTRDIVHEILNKMDPPVAHLSDLDKSFFTSWERLMKGEDDWKALI